MAFLLVAAFAAAPVTSASAEPPSLTIQAPLAGSATNDQTPAFSGSTDDTVDPVALAIYAGASVEGSPVQTLSTLFGPSEGTWDLTPLLPLEAGTYTAVAEQTNVLSETGASAPVTFTVDTSAPVVTIEPVASPTQDPTPALGGSAGVLEGDASHVTVSVHAGESTAGETVASEEVAVQEGAWSFTPPQLADGTYTAQATQQDAAGNGGASSPVTFTVDTTAPTVGVTAPASGSILGTSKPTFGGPAGNESGDDTHVILSVYAGETALGSPLDTREVTRSGGSWTTGSGGPQLADGTYTAQVTQSDTAGNTGAGQATTFTVDTTPPEVTLAAVASPDNDATPKLEGEGGVAAGDGAKVTVTVYRGGSVGGSVAAEEEVSVGAGGAWSYTVPHVQDGTYTARATQEDAAGNGGASSPVTFTIDTTAPTVGLTAPAGGAFLNTSKPTFSGPAGNAGGDSATVTLKIYDGASASGSPAQTVPLTRSGGSWSSGASGPQLPDGTYTAQATQSDAAGNTGVSASRTFTIKTDSPDVTLNALAPSLTNDSTPSFGGTADTHLGDEPSVTLKVYHGTSASGAVVQELEAAANGGAWSATLAQALPDGVYTAQAEQADAAEHVGVSAARTFTVDTTPPHLTLSSPQDGASSEATAQLAGGAAGTAEGDRPEVTVQLFAGASIAEGQTPIESVTVQRSEAKWSATLAGLSVGTYTVRAQQADQAGNLGTSETATFTVREKAPPSEPPPPSPQPTPPAHQPPAAAFAWFPKSPHTGESISLASSSTDAESPIVAFAWDLAGNGAFTTAGSVVGVSFATPGSHVVRLRVTDANGLSDTVAQTIEVTPPSLILMQPFPIVRIAGSSTRSGARLSLLTVQAPAGAHVNVRCRGRGCPAGSTSRIAGTPRGTGKGSVLVGFPRFRRALRAGVVLEVRVAKAGQIGKYTRFTIHRGRAPSRVDECLAQMASKPIACPAS